MPEKVWYGDDWKHADDEPRAIERPRVAQPQNRTRAEAQRVADDLYGKGEISLEQWDIQFARLSNLRSDCTPLGAR